MIIIEIRWQCY